jgi:hypothetical protein
MSDNPSSGEGPAALVVVPAAAHYLHELEGRRLGECLAALGYAVEVASLPLAPRRSYELCCVSSPREVLPLGNAPAEASAALAQLRRASRVMLGFTSEPVALPAFGRSWELVRSSGWDGLIDVGLHCQGRRLLPAQRKGCRFLLDGLTPIERTQLQGAPPPGERPLPWVCIGSQAPQRAALADYLVQHAQPGGAVYLTSRPLGPSVPGRSLDRPAYERLLRSARFQVWCSRHLSFHLEPARFRMSVLAGCVPIKVVLTPHLEGEGGPFPYLVTDLMRLPALVDPGRGPTLWRRLRADYLALPSLAAGLAGLLGSFGLPVRPAVGPAPAPEATTRRAA